MVADTPRHAAPEEVDLWPRASRVYSSVLTRYFEEKGVDVSAPSTASTLHTNSDLVPRRAENLLRWLATIAGVATLEGLDVAEVGSGFGALAAYLTIQARPARVVGIDINDEYLAVGRECARRLGLTDRLSFEIGDMRSLSQVSGAPFDVMIANNAFIYLPTRQDARTALAEFFAATRPGGTVIFHHANKWQWREPFTRDPLVHLLPASAARVVSRVTGWEHNHGRVRLFSPPALARGLRRAGFENVQISGTAVRGGSLDKWFSTFSIITARRPR